jgi:hypothetical protein
MDLKIKIGDQEVTIDEAREIYAGLKQLFEPNIPVSYPVCPIYPTYPDPSVTSPNPWWSIEPYRPATGTWTASNTG